MAFEERNGCEYKYNWLDDTTIHIGHFLVQGGFGQGTGTAVMTQLLNEFADDGATRAVVNIGGGHRTEQFLQKLGFTVRSINEDGHVHAVKHLDA